MTDKEGFSFTGGIRTKRGSATWPLVTMKVTKDKLIIIVSGISRFEFRPSDIVSIESYKGPLGRKGIQITHRVPYYSDTIVFYSSRAPKELLEAIEQSGFTNHILYGEQGSEISRETAHKTGGPIFKTGFLIAMFILWNILFMIDAEALFYSGTIQMVFGGGLLFSTCAFILTATLLLVSESFRKLALTEGKQLEDVERMAFFFIFICSLFFLIEIFMMA